MKYKSPNAFILTFHHKVIYWAGLQLLDLNKNKK